MELRAGPEDTSPTPPAKGRVVGRRRWAGGDLALPVGCRQVRYVHGPDKSNSTGRKEVRNSRRREATVSGCHGGGRACGEMRPGPSEEGQGGGFGGAKTWPPSANSLKTCKRGEPCRERGLFRGDTAQCCPWGHFPAPGVATWPPRWWGAQAGATQWLPLLCPTRFLRGELEERSDGPEVTLSIKECVWTDTGIFQRLIVVIKTFLQQRWRI